MFQAVTVRGARAALLVGGYRQAAVLRGWTISKRADAAVWSLEAEIVKIDIFQTTKVTPLMFSAPRTGGFWAWPVLEVLAIGKTRLTARLGPPEQ